MSPSYASCDVCGAYLVQGHQDDESFYPVVRRFEDMAREQGLLAVRCAKCANLPYSVEEGHPSRVWSVGSHGTPTAHPIASEYNYWPRGIGHLLELFANQPNDAGIEIFHTEPFEIGFYHELDINLIVVAYRNGLGDRWRVTPYSWHAHCESERAVPPLEISSATQRAFRVTLVNTQNDRIAGSRSFWMTTDFANAFHAAIHSHIEQGPPDWEKYSMRVHHLYDLLIDNRIDTLLEAHASLAVTE